MACTQIPCLDSLISHKVCYILQLESGICFGHEAWQHKRAASSCFEVVYICRLRSMRGS